jgi:DHA3 family macrolide efflux protein-like MFS transporter
MRDHPYLELVRDRDVRTLWAGLALSALGSEVYRVGAIWLAVSIAGANGSYLASAQMAATLLMSMFGGAFAELVSRRFLLIGADLVRAAFSFLVLVVALNSGLTLPVLIFTSVVLASCGVLFQPTLQSSLPHLVPQPVRLRATNGLFDATTRSAQVLGPSLAASLIAIMPVAHLLTVNGLSFLASAGAIGIMGHRLNGNGARLSTAKSSAWTRLTLGIRAANGCPGAWRILLTTMVRGAAVALGFSVAIPLLFAQQQEVGWISGVAALALVFGASAAAELASNLIWAAVHPKRPWRALFLGYLMIGVGLALIGGTQLFVPAPLQVPVMVAFASLIGVGNAVAGMQMTTFFGSRLGADAFAGVLRLRLTLITAAAMIATAAGPWALQIIGTVWVIVGCGLAIAAASAISLVSRTHDQLELVPQAP